VLSHKGGLYGTPTSSSAFKPPPVRERHLRSWLERWKSSSSSAGSHPDPKSPENLLDIGLSREGNHVSQSNWLYYDGEIGILTPRCPSDVGVPVHNHGTWEIVGVYKGELAYRLFNRLDDGSRDGYAELQIVEDGVMRAGEFSVCPLPPHDIHGFQARNDDTWMIAVVHGEFAEERLYFDPEKKSYVRRHQKAWRRSLGR
jgi:hypothetical protein